MKHPVLNLLLLSFIFHGCVQPVLEEREEYENDEFIYATISDETKVQLNSRKKTVWTAEDQIWAFYSDQPSVWTFMGKTGDRTGTFRKTAYGSYPADYDFDKIYAVYPYSLFRGWSSKPGITPFFMDAPSVVNYVPGGYAVGENLMLGISDNGTDFRFTNLSSYLKLNIAGSRVVTSITVTGNSEENLAGVFYFFPANPDEITWNSNLSKSVTLDCGSGVKLSSTPSEFIITMMPVDFSAGFCVDIQFSDGTHFSKRTSNPVSLERNVIQPMALIKTDIEDWQYVVISHTGKYLYNPVPEGTSSMNGSFLWGDGTESDLSLGNGFHEFTDGVTSHTVTLKSVNVTGLKLGNMSGITRIDMSNL